VTLSRLGDADSAVCFSTGVARAIKALSPIVHVRGPVAMTRQRSSPQGLENMDISSLSSIGTQSPMTGSIEAAPSCSRSDWQILTAHDNGQMQVWEVSTGVLFPVLRIGTAGPAARCATVHDARVYNLSQYSSGCACMQLPALLLQLSGRLPAMHALQHVVWRSRCIHTT